MSVGQGNLKAFLSCGAIETIRNAFSMSAVIAIGWTLNLSRISKMDWSKLGPAYKQSLREGWSWDLQDAS